MKKSNYCKEKGEEMMTKNTTDDRKSQKSHTREFSHAKLEAGKACVYIAR